MTTSDTDGAGIPEGDTSEAPDSFTANPDGLGDATGTGDAGDVGCKRVLIPHLDLTTPLTLEPNNQPHPILITVVDAISGGPAKGVEVKWAIVQNDGSNGPGPGVLGSTSTVTNDTDGVTSNTFNPHNGPATHYRVVVSSDCADDLAFDIEVQAIPTGMLEVKLQYDNLIPLGQVVEQIVHAPFSCALFKPSLPPTNSVASKSTYIGDVPQIYGPLPATTKYGVTAIVKDVAGNVAAAGCVDAVILTGQSITEVTVVLVVQQAPGP